MVSFMSLPRWTTLAYYAYRATNSAGFYVPVAVVFLTDRGFGLDFVGLSYAVFAVATVAAEIPTGYLGDRIGRRGSLAVGVVVRTLVLGAYPLVDGAAAYLVLHILWATGRTFKSGTVDAWLYELLAAHDATDAYATVESRGSSVLLVTSAATAIAGGLLYGLDPALPFLANAGLAALGLPVLAVAPTGSVGPGDAARDESTPETDADAATPSSTSFTVGDALAVLRAQVRRPAVRWLVVYLALFYAVFGVTRIYEQPALEVVGVSTAALGVLYAAFKLVSAGAAAAVGPVERHLGIRYALAGLIPAYGLAYAALAVAPALVVPVLFLNRGLQVASRPLRNKYLNDRLADVGRATVLSGAAMAMALASAGARLLAAAVVGWTGVVGLLAAAGAVAALAGVVVWVVASPVRDLVPDAPVSRPGGGVEG